MEMALEVSQRLNGILGTALVVQRWVDLSSYHVSYKTDNTIVGLYVYWCIFVWLYVDIEVDTPWTRTSRFGVCLHFRQCLNAQTCYYSCQLPCLVARCSLHQAVVRTQNIRVIPGLHRNLDCSTRYQVPITNGALECMFCPSINLSNNGLMSLVVGKWSTLGHWTTPRHPHRLTSCTMGGPSFLLPACLMADSKFTGTVCSTSSQFSHGSTCHQTPTTSSHCPRAKSQVDWMLGSKQLTLVWFSPYIFDLDILFMTISPSVWQGSGSTCGFSRGLLAGPWVAKSRPTTTLYLSAYTHL